MLADLDMVWVGTRPKPTFAKCRPICPDQRHAPTIAQQQGEDEQEDPARPTASPIIRRMQTSGRHPRPSSERASALQPRQAGAGHELDGNWRLYAILVTYRRPSELGVMLDGLLNQTRRPDRLIVIDNSPSGETQAIAERSRDKGLAIDYLPAPDNLGPAGGIARGMQHLMALANGNDWVVLLDDDDPPRSDWLLAELATFATSMLRQDPHTAAVGSRGARFDRRRGRVVRVKDAELGGPILVDHIAGNKLPLYNVQAIRDMGGFRSELFFGFEELDYGLRLSDAGYSLYAHGAVWRDANVNRRSRIASLPKALIAEPGWRRYYSLRNLIDILRRTGHSWAAVRVTLTRGFFKPLANLPIRPKTAIRHLRLNVRATRDAWQGTLGKTVDPEDPPFPV
ncbi:MAG: glycosyltransferase [Acidimicrobiia bacterium]|nr:glycosyltransferase [Acidimicrobiia bacterium]